MRKKLYLTSALIAVTSVVAGLVIFFNINRIVSYNWVHSHKVSKEHHYYHALSSLQQAQTLLFKHQAEYEVNIDYLVNAVDSFDREISYLEESYIRDQRPRVCFDCHENLGEYLEEARDDVRKIQRLALNFKSKVSIMLTSNDYSQRRKLEKESSDIGGEIMKVLFRTIDAFERMVQETDDMNTIYITRAKDIIIVTAVLVVSFLLAILVITVPQVTRSIDILIKGTEAIAAGNFSERINVVSKDEIGILARRFNRMAGSLEERDRALKELHANLESKVVERTLELESSYEQLRQTASDLEKANRELAELDRMKSDFISIASHELRTPLVTISGYLNLMLEGAAGRLNREQNDMIEVAARGARRLTTITKNILDISRLELKKVQTTTKPIYIWKTIEEAIIDQKSFADRRDQKIICEDRRDLPSITADENMLLQIFINLINNAIKFTPDGGRITISTGLRERDEAEETLKEHFSRAERESFLRRKGKKFLEVVVADTGVGIPPEDRKKVFERFYEVGEVTSHSTGDFKFMGGGMGLGLSIAKGFVEENNGIIWVESSGRDIVSCPGSRFHILLPIAPEEDISSEALTLEYKAGIMVPETAARGRTILLIDDDEDIVEFMETILKDKYDLKVAHSGREGLRLVENLSPDVILLDLLMSDIDGYEITRKLKKDPQTRNIKIILFTAKALKNEIEEGMAAGADDFLTKPFTNKELFDKLDHYLKRKGSF